MDATRLPYGEIDKQPTFHAMKNAPRAIDILAFANVQLLDVAGPLQVFATANDLAAAAGLPRPYMPRVVAPGGMATASAGLGLVGVELPDAHERCDTLIVAGGWGPHVALRDEALVEWVRTRSAHARRTASVCTGAFMLAAAGLLDARRVVTHWTRCEELAARFPAVRVESDPIFIRDGDVWTSAGITAGIDLSLALVEDDLGRAVALDVARQLVVFLKRPGGQAQFSTALALQRSGERFAELHAWIAENLATELSIGTLAARIGMSERSFVRHYRAQTGTTPARAIERMRLEAARRLLSDTTLPVKRIAARCGFGTEETMRRGFLRSLGVSPQAYRQRFSANDTASAAVTA
jgi:transcriptional regulator GlxA family with amidase domain